ncbi:uncharacterized protein LOC132180110 [Corylus avellana]|uniref:uncharacterized protein LOC132180110 n=1 Tax=Corylus avellana TaxID=13451 RepID=UPI00286A8558|nr:uncharacterized protein LOC132180110 [Corylus avellana]
MVFHSLCPSVSQVVTLSFPAMQWAWNIGMEGKGYLPNQWVEPSAAQSMEGEGCNIHGSIEVNKVAGMLDFALAKSFQQPNVKDLGEALFWLLANNRVGVMGT